MKKLYGILKAALGCFLGVFLGMTTYTCWDYRAHPGLYALQSAPGGLSSGRRGGSKILPYKSTDKRVSAVSMRAGHARPLQA